METPDTLTKRSTWLATGLGRQASEDRFDLSVPPSRQALSSSPGGLTPHSARSSKNVRQSQLIRDERSSNGSCRSHRALEGSSLPSCFVPFIFLPRLATPALRLGVFGSLRPSVFYLSLRRYGRRSGQPSSSSLARRACVHVLPARRRRWVAIAVDDSC